MHSRFFIDSIRQEINKLKNLDEKKVNQFLNKISSNQLITKDLNYDEHMCVFFVPVNLDSKSIYLGHHIKAGSWIPPGGHINNGEHPIDSVMREFKEELDFNITDDQIKIFDLSVIKIVNNPRNKCKKHFDMWYKVFVPKNNFNYTKKEYHDAGWFTIDQAISKIEVYEYNQIVRSLKETL